MTNAFIEGETMAEDSAHRFVREFKAARQITNDDFPTPDGYDATELYGGSSDVEEDGVMQAIHDQSREVDVKGRNTSDGLFHVFKDGSALDDETMIAYTKEEFDKLPRGKDGSVRL